MKWIQNECCDFSCINMNMYILAIFFILNHTVYKAYIVYLVTFKCSFNQKYMYLWGIKIINKITPPHQKNAYSFLFLITPTYLFIYQKYIIPIKFLYKIIYKQKYIVAVNLMTLSSSNSFVVTWMKWSWVPSLPRPELSRSRRTPDGEPCTWSRRGSCLETGAPSGQSPPSSPDAPTPLTVSSQTAQWLENKTVSKICKGSMSFMHDWWNINFVNLKMLIYS